MDKNIPERLVGYNLYDTTEKNEKLVGAQAEAELPSFEAITSQLSGAGILGEIENPNPGHFGSMTLPITFRTVSQESTKLFAPGSKSVTLRADQSSYDVAGGKILHRPLKVVVVGRAKSFETGKAKAGDPTDTKVTLEIIYIKIELDGFTLIELDKFNYIFVVNGVDYLADVRNNI